MFNKKVLAMATAALNSAKPPAKKKDIIVDPRGQWEHPGEVTRIPGNNITMQGVPYPVYGVDNTGYGQMMYPGQDYTFPGDYVDEYPIMQKGGQKRGLPTYSDSLALYNFNKLQRQLEKPSDATSDAMRLITLGYSGNVTDEGIRKQKILQAEVDRILKSNPNIRLGTYAGRNEPRYIKNRYGNLVPNFKFPTYKGYINAGGSWDLYHPGIVPKGTWKGLAINEDYSHIKPKGTSPAASWSKSSYKKKYPPIYLSDPNDPRIGSYAEAGNQYLYKPVAPKTNPQLEILKLPTKPLSAIQSSLPEPQIIPFAAPENNNIKILEQKDVPRTMRVPVQSTETYYVQLYPGGPKVPRQRPVTTYQEVPYTDERAGKVSEYDLKTGSYKQTGGAKATCPDGYTYDAVSNTCIPTGEFEYVDDPKDPRLEDYRIQNLLYRYSQLPYNQKEFLDAADILSGDFDTHWNEFMNNPNISDEQKVIFKNDLLGWKGSKAQLWNLSPKELNSFINSKALTYKPEFDYDWQTEELASLMKKYPPSGYQARQSYSSYPYAPVYRYNLDIPERSGLNHFLKPETALIEDQIDRAKLKKIYPNLTDKDIDQHIKITRETPSYITNYRDSWNNSIYNIDGIAREDQIHPLVRRITPEEIVSTNAESYERLPKKGADSYLQEAETHQISVQGSYVPTWLAPKKKYILRTALPTPVIEIPKEPIVEQPVEKEGVKIISEKAVPRTMRRPVQSTETYYVKGPTGQLIPRQRPITTYEEVPWTDERPGEATEYDLNTGTFKKKKGGATDSKKYSRSLEATNKLFHESHLMKKSKSKKKKIYDPYSKYFQEGGEKFEFNNLEKILDKTVTTDNGGYRIQQFGTENLDPKLQAIINNFGKGSLEKEPTQKQCPEGYIWNWEKRDCVKVPKNSVIVKTQEEYDKLNAIYKEAKRRNDILRRVNRLDQEWATSRGWTPVDNFFIPGGPGKNSYDWFLDTYSGADLSKIRNILDPEIQAQVPGALISINHPELSSQTTLREYIEKSKKEGLVPSNKLFRFSEGEYYPVFKELEPIFAEEQIKLQPLPLKTIDIDTGPREIIPQQTKSNVLNLLEQKDVPRTLRIPVQSTETYYVQTYPGGPKVPRQRPITTYQEVPYTDERARKVSGYDIGTGAYTEPSLQNIPMYIPGMYQEGGVPYNYNPFLSTEPEGAEIPMPFTPQRTANDPEDYDQFLSYSETAPENRRPDETYFYGDPNNYDHYGMWDALGKPRDFQQAREMNPDWQPDPYDNMYHGFSVNPNTGVFLKSGKPGQSKPGDTTWMEIAGHYLGRDAQNYTPVFDPELQRFKYIPSKEKGGFQDDVNKRRRLLTDWTYGKDLGLNQNSIGGEYNIGDEVDEATMLKLKQLGYKFQ